MRTQLPYIVVIVLIVLLVACTGSGDESESAPGHYRAELIRTTHGVVHIRAEDYPSLGFGEGYAAAEDHLCNIAWAILEARGELARHFGPGPGNRYLLADLATAALDVDSEAAALLAVQREETRHWIAAYAAGYNHFLEEHNGAAPGSWCAGADWVGPISSTDLAARMVRLSLSLPRLAAAMAAAAPPQAELALATPNEPLVSETVLAAQLEQFLTVPMGSNAWAFGRAGSSNGRGLLFGNPHYPWYGPNRFWEKHLEIPGRLNIYGANLVGAPGVAIGFNRHVAWSHTVSASQRMVFYRLELVPGEPTRYRHGDQERELLAREVSVQVADDSGGLQEHAQTVWFSHHGPIVSLPDMPWSDRHAWAVRDANVGNYWSTEQWRDMAEADGMDALIEAHRRWNAMPWVNTIAASHDGRAVYIDGSSVGHLSDEALMLWQQQLTEDAMSAGAWRERGWIILDGSDPRFDWVETEGQLIRAAVPFESRPFLEREDYVFNANDSYWLSHGRYPMNGYSPLYGPTETARSLRTRMNALLLEGRTEPRFSDAEGRFSMAAVQAALMANHSLAADLLLPSLIAACFNQPMLALDDGATVDVAAACDVLSGFDGRFTLDQPGAVLFREWLSRYDFRATLTNGELFAEGFSSASPLDSPAGLGDPALALRRLAEAAAVLQAADLPLDARLAETQFAWRGDRPIPVPGGNSHEGVANLMVAGRPDWPTAAISPTRIADSRQLTDHGYPIIHGTSFVMVVGWDDNGPVAEALLAYGQSGDPAQEAFTDQTEWFREGRWRTVRYTPEAIAADQRSSRIIEGARARPHPAHAEHPMP